MNKIDLKKELGEFYSGKPGEPVTVVTPPMQYLIIYGEGGPTSQDYADAIQTVYPIAYSLKFMCKKELGKDFTVMPLEGLWWAEDMSAFAAGDREEWKWTAMIMQPDFITEEMFEVACKQVKEKKASKALDKVKFEVYEEGRAAQVMHIGPYADEGPTIIELHKYLESEGGKLDATNKNHHEIYLSDPRRTAPEKLKTIIRQPF